MYSGEDDPEDDRRPSTLDVRLLAALAVLG